MEKVVMVFGTFDIVHAGHLHLFREARVYGNKLIAVVARDKNVEKIKGQDAINSEEERLDFLQHIDLIDEVILGDEKDYFLVIKERRPDIIALGYDQKIPIDNLEEAITEYGLQSRIVRLSPYKEDKFKTSKIKEYLKRLI